MLKLKNKIQNNWEISKFLGPPLDAGDIANLVDVVQGLLPSGISRMSLLGSTTYLGNCPFTENELRDYAWRLAGNLSLLRAGKPVVPWVRQVEEEWMPMQIVSCQLKRDRGDRVGAEYTFRVLAGTAVGALVKKFWSRKFCSYAARNIGFTSQNKKFPFRDVSELVGLRLYGLFTPELSSESPRFDTIQASSAFLTYNRELIKKRFRVDFQCPKGYQFNCHQCPIGYDKCSLGTHAQTYERHECQFCNLTAWFDMKKNSDMCIECYNKRMLKQDR